VRRYKEVSGEATGEGEGAISSDCACLQRGPKHPDMIICRDLGCDETQGRYADVDLVRCGQCRRLWLRYHVEYEAISRSARWAEALIDSATAATITATAAPEFLDSADWYVFGGSYYGHAGKRGRGRLNWGP
jgi:hypothetical protein